MKRLLPIFLAFTLINGYSQTGAKQFSLDEAIQYAVTNNANSKNADLDIESGKHRVMENIALGLPQINGEMNYLYYIEPSMFVFPDVLNGNPNQFITFPGSPLNSLSMTATASMPVVSGPYFIGIQAAKSYYALLEQQKEKTNVNVKEEVIKAYYLALIAQESKQVVDSTLKIIERTVYETEQIFKEGLIEELDVKQLKLTESNIRDLSKQLESNVQLTMYALKYQMAYPLEEEIELTDDLENLILGNDFSTLISGFADSVDVTKNIDYRLISQKLELDQFQVKLQKSMAYPTLSTFFQVGGNFFNNDRWLFLGDGTISTLNGVIWGFNLNIPIFSSWNRVSKLKQLKIEVKKTQNTQIMVEDGLQLAYKSATIGVENNFNKYLTAKDNFELAGEIRRVNGIKYKEGLISSLNLTQAEQQYFDSQQKYFQAIYDLLLSKIELDKSLNQF